MLSIFGVSIVLYFIQLMFGINIQVRCLCHSSWMVIPLTVFGITIHHWMAMPLTVFGITIQLMFGTDIQLRCLCR